MKIKSIKRVELDSPKQYYDVINADPYNNFPIKTNSGYIMSHNCFFDEISFQPQKSIEEQKIKAKELVNTASARMQSRFMKGERNPTLLILASSKRTEQSYLETFIENKKKKESKTTLVIDEPQWVIRTDKDSKNKFKVAVGNKFLDSEILPLNITEDEAYQYTSKGYNVIDVPMGYYEAFNDDINIALTDIAGISTTNVTKYISGTRLLAVKKNTLQNLFTKDIITVGNAPNDTTQYYDFIDLTRLDHKLKSKPMYIHLDMSVSGDKTGIAGIWIIGKKPHQDGLPDSKELYYQLAFNVSIKAPKGFQVSFEKNKQLIYWLREQGFNIKGLSTDTFQNVAFAQSVSASNFNYQVISVDRVNTDHICVPYQTLKNVIYEERIAMYDSKLLTEELLNLERDGNGKIDHPESGSKDAADAVAGSIYNASQHAEEYAFEYGEDIQTMLSISSNEEIQKQQIVVNLEEELKNAFNNNSNTISLQHDNYNPFYVANGILL